MGGQVPHDLTSYAGNGEDLVIMRAFGSREAGCYVDVGAGEPDRGSLTKNLVDVLGWRGVNIEPLPERYARLCAARPGDVNLQVAIDAEPGRATFYRIAHPNGRPDELGLSSLDTSVRDMHARTGHLWESLQVDVVTLESVLRRHAFPGFDLLKVDVEGREAGVLASADLTYWRPRALVVEATVPLSDEPSHHAWEPMVLAAGYRLAQFDGLNRFYAYKDEPELLRALSVPASP
jgi:FkbM family methyltransferase